MNTSKWLFSFLIFFYSFALPAAEMNKPVATELKVGVVSIYPFGWVEREQVTGLAYDIWHLIEKENNFTSKYINVGQDIDKAIKMVQKNEIDAIIGPIGMSRIDIKPAQFTVPYFNGEFVLLVKKVPVSVWQIFRQIFNSYMIGAFLLLILMYFLFLNIFWLYEHHTHPYLKGKTYTEGLGITLWRSLLGRRLYPSFPKTTPMRIISLIGTILFTIVFISIFAGLTASLINIANMRSQAVQSIAEIRNNPIAAIGGQASKLAGQALDLNIAYTPASTGDAIYLLDEKVVGGILMLLAPAEEYLYNTGRTDLYIAPMNLSHIPLGFVINSKWQNLLPGINKSIIKMSKDGTKDSICALYLDYISAKNCKVNY